MDLEIIMMYIHNPLVLIINHNYIYVSNPMFSVPIMGFNMADSTWIDGGCDVGDHGIYWDIMQGGAPQDS